MEEGSYLEDPLVVDFPLEVMVQEGFEGEVHIDHNNHLDEDGDKSEYLGISEETKNVRIKLEKNDDKNFDVKNYKAKNVNDQMNCYPGKHESEHIEEDGNKQENQSVRIKLENNDDNSFDDKNDFAININDKLNTYEGKHENEHVVNCEEDGNKQDNQSVKIKLEKHDDEFNISDRLNCYQENHESEYLGNSEDDDSKQENPSSRINNDNDDDSCDARNDDESNN